MSEARGESHKFNPWSLGTSLAIAWGSYYLMDWLYVNWPTNIPLNLGHRAIRHASVITDLTIVAIGIFALVVAIWVFPRQTMLDQSRSRWHLTLAALPLIVFASFYVLDLRGYYILRSAWVEDVGKITIRSDIDLIHGIDPYAVDVQDSRMYPDRVGGYVYFPVMLLAYFPAAVIYHDPDQAVLLTNLAFAACIVALLWMLAGRFISPDAGPICALLFLLSALIRWEYIRFGANDGVPMALAMAALLCIRRRFTCGLLVGLAICAKMLPGLFFVALCLTPPLKRRYIAGVSSGLLPMLPFLIWNPHAIISSALLAVAHRGSEDNSLFWNLPIWSSPAAQIVVLVGFAIFALYCLRHEIPMARRCAFATALLAMFEVASPLVHQNYFLWWYAPMCVMVTAIMFTPGTYEWIAGKSVNCEV